MIVDTLAQLLGWSRGHPLFRLINERADWVVLDTETTGYNENSEVIELAVVSADGTALLDQLIMPKGRIPSDATRVHGIDRKMLKACPIWPKIQDDVSSLLRDKIVITYNAEFDLRLLKQSAAKWGMEPPIDHAMCAMRAYAEYRGIPHPWRQGEFKWHKLSGACRNEGVKVSGAHRALADALMTRELLLRVAEAC